MKAYKHSEQGAGEQHLAGEATGGSRLQQGIAQEGGLASGARTAGLSEVDNLGQERVINQRTEREDHKKGTVYEARPKAIVYEERPKEDVYEKVPARTVQTVQIERVVPASGGPVQEYAVPASFSGTGAHTYEKDLPASMIGNKVVDMTRPGQHEHHTHGGHHMGAGTGVGAAALGAQHHHHAPGTTGLGSGTTGLGPGTTGFGTSTPGAGTLGTHEHGLGHHAGAGAAGVGAAALGAHEVRKHEGLGTTGVGTGHHTGLGAGHHTGAGVAATAVGAAEAHKHTPGHHHLPGQHVPEYGHKGPGHHGLDYQGLGTTAPGTLGGQELEQHGGQPLGGLTGGEAGRVHAGQVAQHHHLPAGGANELGRVGPGHKGLDYQGVGTTESGTLGGHLKQQVATPGGGVASSLTGGQHVTSTPGSEAEHKPGFVEKVKEKLHMGHRA